ncbi:MAG: hypothetical protein JRN23_07265, partial [Nitrososphaerota archaeon]|nr:hypothetical protein [Nitrososphaerota archaeon]
MRWARHGGRRGVSEVVAVLLLVAIVVGLAVVVAAFAGSTLEGLGGGVDGLLSSQASAAAQHLVVEHAAFTFATTLLVSPLALDGSATNQVAGSSTSIAASLTTSSASDVVVAYVSPADTGATAPPSVSGLSGGGLSWHHRATAPSETYTISYYVPVTITNNQASATPNPFQQKVTWNPSSYSAYEASDLGNVRFCADTACNTPLYAWLESCTGTCGPAATLATAWVKLTSSIAANGGSTTIYMVFQPTSTEFDGVYWGEAPNLSATYGQYDNGANVFTQYGGKSWSSFTTIGGTWDTTNGYLEQTSTTGSYNGGPAAVIEGASYAASGSYVIDTAFSYTTQATPRVGVITVATPSGGDVYGYRFIGQQSNNGAGFISFLNDMTAWVVNGVYDGSTATSYTMEVVDSAGTWSGTLFSGYGTGGTALTTMGATAYTSNNNAGAATGYVGVSAGYYTGSTVVGNPAAFQWFAMRALPPGGVMPS